MPVSYNKLTVEDKDLNRVQAEVARSFQAVPDAVTDADGITTADTSNGLATFKVPESCKWLVCLTNGNALTVSLPSPSSKKAVMVLCSGGNKVTVQRQDGKPGLYGSSVVLENNQSRLFVATGKDWA